MKTTKFVVVVAATFFMGFLGKAQVTRNTGGSPVNATPTTVPSNISQFEVSGKLITQNSFVGLGAIPVGQQTGDFGASASWNSMGNLNAGSQTLNGFRTQTNGRALTFGHTINNNTGALSNSLIQWGGNNSISVLPGDLEFRSFINPGIPGIPASDDLRFSIRGADGTGLFGASTSGLFSNPKFEINGQTSLGSSNYQLGLAVYTRNNNIAGSFLSESTFGEGINQNTGITSKAKNSSNNYGIISEAMNDGGDEDLNFVSAGVFGTGSIANTTYGVIGNATIGKINFGVLGQAFNGSGICYGVYGNAFGSPFNAAGYFAGSVYANSYITLSDKKLKENVANEKNAISKIMKLKPVTYNMNAFAEKMIGKDSKVHHGFLAQDMQAVFPELVYEVKQPVLENNKVVKTEDLLSVNYQMLIPILTKAIQELNSKVDSLSNLLNGKQTQTFVVKENNTTISEQILNETAYSLSQNVPNPFTSNTVIKYTVPATSTNASIAILNLNGTMLQQFNGLKGSGSITINGNTLQAGIYLYSLISNGQEIITKRMVLTK